MKCLLVVRVLALAIASAALMPLAAAQAAVTFTLSGTEFQGFQFTDLASNPVGGPGFVLTITADDTNPIDPASIGNIAAGVTITEALAVTSATFEIVGGSSFNLAPFTAGNSLAVFKSFGTTPGNSFVDSFSFAELFPNNDLNYTPLFLAENGTDQLSLTSGIAAGVISGDATFFGVGLGPGSAIVAPSNAVTLNSFTSDAESDIPEPATLALLGAGLAAMGLGRRRRAVVRVGKA